MPPPNAIRPLTEVLRSTGDDAPSLETKVRYLQSFRRAGQQSRDLDEFLVGELETLRGALREAQTLHERLRANQAELAAEIEKLRAPPLHEAVYLGTELISGRRLATVVHHGSRHLVELEDESLLSTLTSGDAVFLAHGLGVIIGKGHDRNAIGETATVEHCLPDHRLMLRDRDVEVVVEVTEPLREELPGPGDQVLWSRDTHLAFGKVESGRASSHIVDVQEISERPTRVGGLGAKLGRLLSLFTTCLTDPDLARRYGLAGYNHSALLVGPPGCGKTLVARTIAYEITCKLGVPCRFAVVNGAELESAYVGETQRNIRRLFRELAEMQSPAVLYIDEVEAIGRHRGHFASQHADRFLSQWLTCLDGFRQRENIAIIGASNRKNLIDAALLERLSGLEIPVGRPSRDGAGEIFAIHLPQHLPFGADGAAPAEIRRTAIESAVSRLYDPNADNEVAVLRFRDGTRRTIAARELVSGRLIAQVCRAAQHRALVRAAEIRKAAGDSAIELGDEEGITVEDMTEAVADAIDKLSSTLTHHNAHHYLPDLSPDADVVSVEPVRRRVRRHRYLVA